MNFDYARTAATAARLLTQFGQAVTLSRPSTAAETYDPTLGTNTPNTPATYAGKGVALDYNQREIDGALIKVGDQRLLLSPASPMVEPATSDTVALASGTVFKIMSAKKVSPAGTPVLYDVQLRGVG